MKLISGVSMILFIWIVSCTTEESSTTPFPIAKPEHFPPILYNLESNPLTQEGFKLGRKLFNDPILSSDGSVACSNCHVKQAAFTDPQHRLSLGVDERAGIRNAPSIANMAFFSEFVWDGGIIHLDFVPPNAIENPLEMNESLSHVMNKLNRHAEYPELFRQAFPDMDTITSAYLLKSLSQYQLHLISATSRYDQVILGKEVFSEDEKIGFELFSNKCSQCHAGQLFTNMGFSNNGLDTEFADLGRARITESVKDLGKFRIPSLRNCAVTAPYMHDGRFKSLEEVLEHYEHGVHDSPTLDPLLKEAGHLGIFLSANEKQSLLYFLNTLTDHDFIYNPDL